MVNKLIWRIDIDIASVAWITAGCRMGGAQRNPSLSYWNCQLMSRCQSKKVR